MTQHKFVYLQFYVIVKNPCCLIVSENNGNEISLAFTVARLTSVLAHRPNCWSHL